MERGAGAAAGAGREGEQDRPDFSEPHGQRIRLGHLAAAPARVLLSYFADTPSLSLLRRLLKVEGVQLV